MTWTSFNGGALLLLWTAAACGWLLLWTAAACGWLLWATRPGGKP